MVESCEFETERLVVREWHAAGLPPGRELADVVIELLTPAVTRTLPAGWRGAYSPERARSWIAERDREGAALLATERSSGEPVALVVLREEAEAGADRVQVRLGYVVAETAWGRGLASELVAGLVGWCRSQPRILSMAGGTDPGHAASARVLTKNGFAAIAGPPGMEGDLYELRFHRIGGG